MKHYLDLVSISNKVHRRQSRMTRICIVLAVFLVAVMFGLADMYLKSMTDETRHQTGDWHCKITAIDEKTSEYIAARPEIDLSGWQGNIPAEIGCTVADQPVSVAGMDETIFSEIYLGSVLSGEFPEIAGQVAVSSTLAQTAGISLGDTLTLNSPDGSTMQLAITGIMDDDAANMISGSASAVLLTPEGLSSIQTADLSGNWQYVVRFSLLTNVGSSIADIQQQNGISDAQITQNEELLSMLGQLPGSNMSQIDNNPTIYLTAKGGGVPQKDKAALTDEQAARLLDAIQGLPPYVFVMLGLYAGLRREEILALKWDSVYLDVDCPYLTVRRAWHTENNRPVILDELKTKAAHRNIPLPVCLADCLKETKANSQSEYVVPNRDGDPLSYTQFKRLWQYIVTRTVKERFYYRYEDGKRVKHTVTPVLGEKAAHNGKVIYSLDFEVTPHQLRHTYITNLIHSSVDPKTVQYLAGHESSKITMDIYAKVKYNRPDELVRTMGGAFAQWDAAQA